MGAPLCGTVSYAICSLVLPGQTGALECIAGPGPHRGDARKEARAAALFQRLTPLVGVVRRVPVEQLHDFHPPREHDVSFLRRVVLRGGPLLIVELERRAHQAIDELAGGRFGGRNGRQASRLGRAPSLPSEPSHDLERARAAARRQTHAGFFRGIQRVS